MTCWRNVGELLAFVMKWHVPTMEKKFKMKGKTPFFVIHYTTKEKKLNQ